MKILMIANEFPYPPTSGGRSDIWRRLKALHSLGDSVMLITWAYENSGLKPSAQQVETLEQIVHQLIIINISATPLQRGFKIFRYPLLPWPALCRILSGSHLRSIESKAKDFNPDIVLLEGLYGYDLAKKISSDFKVPLIYRSQNVEYEFFLSLWRAAAGVKEKLRLALYLKGLRRYELSAIESATLVYDISIDGMKFWQRRGYSHIRLLPPFLDKLEPATNRAAPIRTVAPKYLCGYLGNLYSPANIHGIKWFCNHVLKLLPDNSRILIAGSRPTSDIATYLNQYPQVHLWANPESIEEVYLGVQVLVNPIFHGSGVSIKTVDMIASGKPIVSTSLAKRGLSDEVCRGLFFDDDPVKFAQAILTLAKKENSFEEFAMRQEVIESNFGSAAVRHLGISLREIRSPRH